MKKRIHVLLCPQCKAKVVEVDPTSVVGFRKWDFGGRACLTGRLLSARCHECRFEWDVAEVEFYNEPGAD